MNEKVIGDPMGVNFGLSSHRSNIYVSNGKLAPFGWTYTRFPTHKTWHKIDSVDEEEKLFTERIMSDYYIRDLK